MKTLKKILIGILYIPLLGLAGVGALIKLIFTLTVMFTLDHINIWHDQMLLWVDNKIKELKK